MSASRLLLAFILLLLVAAPSGAETSRPLRIGVIQSLSGIAAENGTTVLHALQLAVDQLPAGEVELFVEDDRTDPKQAVTAFQNLRVKGVDAIVGATWDFTTLAINPLARQYKIPLLTVSTVVESLALTGKGDFAFASSLSAEAESQPLERWVKQEKVRSVVVLTVGNSWGEAQQIQYLKRLSDAGVKILEKHSSAGMEDNDWRPLMPRIKSLLPEGIVLILNRGDIEQTLRRLKEVGVDVPVFTANQGYDSFRLSADKKLFAQICLPYPAQALEKNEFQARFQKRFGEPARVYADNAYDSVGLLLAAQKISKGSLRDALEDVSYDGLAGHYSFDPKRSLSTGSSSLVCVTDGAIKIQK